MDLNLNKLTEGILCNIETSWSKEPSEGVYANFPNFIDPELIKVLSDSGITQLYLHQAWSIQSLHSGNNIIISTGTASGKSICYQIPIISSILEKEDATALLLFPTKALAADQYKSFSNISSRINKRSQKDIRIGVYDGDISKVTRVSIRNLSNIIITNPDMLHLGILPHHPTWARFFSNLKFIVIDEAHIYSGVFGSHFVNLIRRLKRITTYYGSRPQFILSSATISDPEEFAQQLIEDDVDIFNEDYSPKGKRNFIFYNPPIVDEELGIRKSMIEESILISQHLLSLGLQTISFARSRTSVEMIYKKLSSLLPIEVSQIIAPYRSGYSKIERRKIEDDLKNRKIELIIATIALELGIDIGTVDVILMNGYPGSITRFLQQSGRAGRKNKESFCILVASSLPIDQYIIHHSDYIKTNLIEKIYFDGNNPYILFNHIRAAAFELPFHQNDGFGKLSSERIKEYLDVLQQIECLFLDNGRYFWSSGNYPTAEISLRSIGGNPVQIIEINKNKRSHLGNIDASSSKRFLYPGAIYLHQGESYLVNTLDINNGYAEISPANNSIYFTKPLIDIETEILKIDHEQKLKYFIKGFGEIKVTEKVKGYNRHLWESQTVIGQEFLDLEPDILETKGGWLQFAENNAQRVRSNNIGVLGRIEYGSKWPAIRENILVRDKFTCQFCGKTEIINELHVHHKIPVRLFPKPEDAHSESNLITLCQTCHKIAERNLRIRSTLSGLGFGLQNIFPVFVKCSVHDVGVTFNNSIKSSTRLPGIIFYDQFPGGLGLSEMIYNKLHFILEALYDHINKCPCKTGCPSCVGPGGENGYGAKEGVNELLKSILERD